MILKPSIDTDLQQIWSWQEADKWRFSQEPPEWWLTGEPSLFTTRVDDETGPLAYVRVNEEPDTFRLYTLFAPDVPSDRMGRGIVEFIRMLKSWATDHGKRILTQSENPKLRGFLVNRLGFIESGTNVSYKAMEQ